jgi:hypothetical protein
LADYLKDFSKATAVYIGKLVSPKRAISDHDDESVHRDDDAAKIIHYLHATHGHEYLVDKVLKQEQGLTFDVFKEEEPVEQERILEEGEEGFEEQQERFR